jgi:glycosyltransferase involved in cell wall biosynthesis
VVDDGSTDNTKEVLKGYPSSLKYFYKENGGITHTRNFMLITGEDLEIVSRMMVSGININHCIEEVYYLRRLHGNNSIITMDYSVKNIIYPNLIRNLRKNITAKK